MDEPEVGPSLQDIRFAVVLNGGVSLAVWMGGATHELNELTWASGGRAPAYREALKLINSTARADVISGTSAGGINGAALALGQSNRHADLAGLRELWAEQGRMETLLRTPFEGQPTSLLRGDHFRDELRRALCGLTARYDPGDRQRDIDLTLTTTLLTGARHVTVDDFGARISDIRHDGTFRFRTEDFCPENVEVTLGALATAARGSASFPLAFEPTYVHVPKLPPQTSETCPPCRHGQQIPDDVAPGPPDPHPPDPDQPAMTRFVDWDKGECASDGGWSRYVVDGGVLANTPTRLALDGIERMAAETFVRRVMVLVYPHAPGSPATEPVRAAQPPTVAGMMRGVAAALTSQGNRTFADQVDRHNRAAASWRDGRAAVLALVAEKGDTQEGSLTGLLGAWWPLYRAQRIRQEAVDWVRRLPGPTCRSTSVARERAQRAQERWSTAHGRRLPYLPAKRDELGFGWPWGPEMAISIADAVFDVQFRALGLVVDPTAAAALRRARECASRARDAMRCVERRLWSSLEVDAKPADVPPDDDAYWTDALDRYQELMDGGFAAALRCRVNEAVGALYGVRGVFTGLRRRDPEGWRKAGLTGWERLFAEPTERAFLERLIDLEVATAAVADGRRPSSTVPIDLVQLSVSTRGPLLDQQLTDDDKLAGLSLGHFGGFLKRSWRVNDWIWGRLDAAAVLSRVVLTDDHLARECAARAAAQDAEDWVRGLAEALFDSRTPPGRLGELVDDAVTAVRGGSPTAHDAVRDLVIAGRQLEIIAEELRPLAAAVDKDRRDGADPRSNGESFVETNKDLISCVGSSQAMAQDKLAGLMAFEKAGIGREPLMEQMGSDLLTRTTVRAAAVATTVLDSERLGAPLVRPVTKTVRGALLLPYWVISGLGRGTGTLRFLALLALVVGGVLVSASVLGVLPSPLATPGALLGVGALLTGLGYAALRSGSLVHSALLFLPVSPLLAYATARFVTAEDGAAGVAGISVVVLMLAVVGVLMLLASMPNPVSSPWWLVRGAGRTRPDTAASRRRDLILPVAAVVIGAVVVASLVVLAVRVAVGTGWSAVVAPVPVWARVLLLVAVWLGGVATAFRGGLWLRLWRRRTGEEMWTLHHVAHPAGVSAGWAVVYGTLYVAVAAGAFWLSGKVALRKVEGTPEQKAVDQTVNSWHWALLGLGVGAVILALVLVLLAPAAYPARARRAVTRSLVGDEVLCRAVRGQSKRPEQARRVVEGLQRRGTTYRYLVAPRHGDDTVLGAAPATMDVVAAIVSGSGRPWCAVPGSAHLLAGALAVGLAVGLRLGGVIVGPTAWGPLLAVGGLLLVGLAIVEGRRLKLGPDDASPDAAAAGAGKSAAGQSAAGESAAGESAAGQSAAGESAAGESAADKQLPWLVVGGALGLLLIAVAAACGPLWPADREACAVLSGMIVGAVAGLQVLAVLYARRWFCRRA